MHRMNLNITAIPAFGDNYIWLLTADGPACAVVDPGDARPVLEVLENQGLDLRYILLTHHHHDHTGGVGDLLKKYAARVFGPDDERIPFTHDTCREGDLVNLADLHAQFRVLEVPAHTRTHIAFYGENALFSGDTLFSVGCGRFFEGTADDMQRSLDKLATLPATTRVYPAHEYTQSNCAFALQVEPENAVLKARADAVDRLRAAGRITLPTTLGDELAANPFMRTHEKSVLEAARKIDPGAMPGSSAMAAIRAWKDRF
ncbi:MAG: hydroxyacylglutathione hydrolase [Gammaproteobacteria bacterium]|nr:MAG: hydroxyacylglutathione hydrolase [Gammaproteobacteria bacterium]